jgi:DNA-binding transcriptional regulator YhcF (GntR family)
LTIYSGDKLPPYYIGSTSIKKIKEGYCGSVSSKKYSKIFFEEVKNNRHLFTVNILGTFHSREDALECERLLQHHHNAVKSNRFINLSYASKNGFFGRDVSGKANPRYGKQLTEKTKNKISKARYSALSKNRESIVSKQKAAMLAVIDITTGKTLQQLAIEKMVAKRKMLGNYVQSQASYNKMRQTRLNRGLDYTYTVSDAVGNIIFNGSAAEFKKFELNSQYKGITFAASKQFIKQRTDECYLYSSTKAVKYASQANKENLIGLKVSRYKYKQ